MNQPPPAKGRNQLGRGLSALFGEDATAAEGEEQQQTRTIPIVQLVPNPNQPRRQFDEQELRELATSIDTHGVLQPILVRPDPRNPQQFQIVAGERRWRAAQIARLHQVPVLVKNLSDSGTMEIAIVENVQRQDLNPLEEADGYHQLVDGFGHRQEDLAKIVGKSRSHIANTLRLLNLPQDVQELVVNGSLSAGHARALLNTDNPSDLARLVVKQGLSVRETEKLAKSGVAVKGTPKPPKEKDPNTVALERDIGQRLGLKVSLNDKGNKGELVVHYRSLEQLDLVINLLRTGQ